MGQIQVVVFDLYGTLLHITQKTNPYKRLWEDIGLETSEQIGFARNAALMMSFSSLKDYLKFLQEFLPCFNRDVLSYEQEIRQEVMSAELYPDTMSVLNTLREGELKLGLISNLATPYKEPFFTLGLDVYFDRITFSCEVGFVKPQKAIYQKMAMNLGIDPTRILVVGDSVKNDVEGPQSIEMNTVHLDRSGVSPNSICTLEGIFDYL